MHTLTFAPNYISNLIYNFGDSLYYIIIIFIVIVLFIIWLVKPDYLIAMAEKEYESRMRMMQDHIGSSNTEYNFDFTDLHTKSEPIHQSAFQNNIVCFATDCPLIINNSSLVLKNRDNQTLLNIAFQNIGEKTITAIDMKITALDQNQNTIAVIDNFQYPSVKITKAQIYDNAVNIYLPSVKVTSVKMAINKVTFEDGEQIKYAQNYYTVNKGIILTKWNASWQHYLQKNKSKFGLSANKSMIYEPVDTNEYWRCTCSQVNLTSYSTCINCERDKDTQFEYINQEKISNLINESSNSNYVPSSKEQVESQIEQLNAEREEAKLAALEQRKKEAKFIGAAIIALLILVVILYS